MNNAALLFRDAKKYVDYIFETKGFTSECDVREVSDRALRSARSIRGADRAPAIMIHGVMPRCGSVYAGELLRRHPDVHAYPHEIWEFPALPLTNRVRGLQENFLLSYKPNIGKLGDDDFLPLIGASLLAYLYEPAPPDTRLLVKMPSVQYLSQFFSMFPHENLLILVRDGRDLVHSTLRTWPHLNFLQVCLRWNRSARMILTAREQFEAQSRNGWWLAKYEDALQEPNAFVREACRQFGLSEDRYPYDEIDGIKVIGSSKLEHKQGKVSWRWVKRPKDFKPTKYWHEWSAARKLAFKLLAGRSLIDLGYAEDLKW